MPSNGAIRRLKDSIACRWSRLALADATIGGSWPPGRCPWHRRPGAPRALRQKRVPALGGDCGKLLVGDGGVEIGLALGQLAVEIGRIDLGQQLALLHRRADIDIPFLHIAADLGVDRRVGEGLNIARQDEVAAVLDAVTA